MHDRNEYMRKYREAHREKLRVYNAEYNRLWRGKNGFEAEYRWKKKNRIKVNVEKILGRAVKRGDIKRLPCVLCGKKKSVAHHPNYHKPLDVVFLCHVHHREIHYRVNKKVGKNKK